MKKTLRWLGRKCRITTWYHVAATYQRDGHMGMADISLTVSVMPWIHEDNYPDVVAYVKSQADKPAMTPCITSITRLGP